MPCSKRKLKCIFMALWKWLFICFFLTTGKDLLSQSQKGFSIIGSIEGLKDGTLVYLVKNSSDGLDTISRSESKNGKFYFKGEVPLEAEIHFIRLDTNISKKAKT